MNRILGLLLVAILGACSGTSVYLFDETMIEGTPKTVATPPLRVWTAESASELAAALAEDFAVTSTGERECWLVAGTPPDRGGPAYRRLQLLTEERSPERAQALLDGRADAAFVPSEGLARFADRSRFQIHPDRQIGSSGESMCLVTVSRFAGRPPFSSPSEREFWVTLLRSRP